MAQVAQAGGLSLCGHSVENGRLLLVWTKNDMSPARGHAGTVIGVFEEAVELRCSGKVDGLALAFAKLEPPATTLLVARRSLQEVSRAMFPAVLTDNGRIGTALMQRGGCAEPETLHDFRAWTPSLVKAYLGLNASRSLGLTKRGQERGEGEIAGHVATARRRELPRCWQIGRK
ncbi:hypothetical protein N431DRAFT_489339 [Stipitochalara longipes BDJ]|nr:hypothetical protein N431DRAFT_489339 [Stipitochalara longipes BDJ]